MMASKVSLLSTMPTTMKDANAIRTMMGYSSNSSSSTKEDSGDGDGGGGGGSSTSDFAALLRQRQQQVLKKKENDDDDGENGEDGTGKLDTTASSSSSTTTSNSNNNNDGLFSAALRKHREKLVDTWEEGEEEEDESSTTTTTSSSSQQTCTTVPEEESSSSFSSSLATAEGGSSSSSTTTLKSNDDDDDDDDDDDNDDDDDDTSNDKEGKGDDQKEAILTSVSFDTSAIISSGSSNSNASVSSRASNSGSGSSSSSQQAVDESIENANKAEALAQEMHRIVEEELHRRQTTTTVVRTESDPASLLLKDTTTTTTTTMTMMMTMQAENDDTDLLLSDIDDEDEDEEQEDSKQEVAAVVDEEEEKEKKQKGGQERIEDDDELNEQEPNGTNNESSSFSSSVVVNLKTNIEDEGDAVNRGEKEVIVVVNEKDLDNNDGNNYCDRVLLSTIDDVVGEEELSKLVKCLQPLTAIDKAMLAATAAAAVLPVLPVEDEDVHDNDEKDAEEVDVVAEEVATDRVEDRPKEEGSITTTTVNNNEIVDDIDDDDQRSNGNGNDDEMQLQLQMQTCQDVTEEENDDRESTATVTDVEVISSSNIQENVVEVTTAASDDTGCISTDTTATTTIDEMNTNVDKSLLLSLSSPSSSLTKKAGTRVMSFAERMKKMFDSSSPDEPSMAFVSTTSIDNATNNNANSGAGSKISLVSPNVLPSSPSSPSSSPLAERMKQMFDSTSPDEPSVAFGNNKNKAPRAVGEDDSSSSNDEKEESFQMKKEGNDSIVNNDDQLAHQMVSLLWTSSSSKATTKKKENTKPTATFPTNKAAVVDVKDGDDATRKQHQHQAEGIEEEDIQDEEKDQVDEQNVVTKTNPSTSEQMVSLLWASSAKTTTSKKDPLASTPISSCSESESFDDENAEKEEEEEQDGVINAVIRDTAAVNNDGYGHDTIEEITIASFADDMIPVIIEEVEEEVEVQEEECTIIDGYDEEDICDDDDGESVEEVTIVEDEYNDGFDEDDHNDGMTVTTAGEIFETAACVEISSDFINNDKNGDHDHNHNHNDGQSYDELTADDWEYDENTVDDDDLLDDDNDEAVVVKDHNVEEKSVDGTKNATNDNAGGTTTMIVDSIITSNNNPVKGASGASEDIPATTSAPTTAPTKRGKLVDRLKMFDSSGSNSIPSAFVLLGRSSSQKENSSSFVIGLSTEKNDSRPAVVDKPTVNEVPKKDVTWRSLKPVMKSYVNKESKREALNLNPYAVKTPEQKLKPTIQAVAHVTNSKPSVGIKMANPSSTTGTMFDKKETASRSFVFTSIDEAPLVDRILVLLNEPGCMENKNILAQRIASLLLVSSTTNNDSDDGKYDDNSKALVGTTTTTTACSLTTITDADPPTDSLDMTTHSSYHNRRHNGVVGITKNSPTMTMLRKKLAARDVQEDASAYIVRKNDGFKDQGLKKWKNDAVAQRENLRRCYDPDSVSVRRMKRVSISELKEKKEEEEKQQQQNVSSSTSPFNQRRSTPPSLAAPPPPPPPSTVDNSILDNKNIPSPGSPQSLSSPVAKSFPSPVAATNEIKGNNNKTDTLLAEHMIAKIWPTDKVRKPTQLRKHEKNSNLKAPPSAKKLGDRLKMFNSPLVSSPSSSVSPSSSFPRPRRVSFSGSLMTREVSKAFVLSKKSSATTESSIEDAVVTFNNVMPKEFAGINGNTLKQLSSFQRLWRKTHKAKKISPLSPVPAPSTPTSTNTNRNESMPPPAGADAGAGGDEKDGGVFYYTLDDFEQKRVNLDTVDIGKWECYFDDEEFRSKFGMTKNEFYQQPKWKQDKQKRKVRVSF